MKRVLLMGAVALLLLMEVTGPVPQSAEASFPGANGRIAFTSDRDGVTSIWAMDPNGANVRRVLFSASHGEAPSWSADGRWIAFSSTQQGETGVWVTYTGGNYPRYVTSDAPTETEGDPAWSPDGTTLAYTASNGQCGQQDLWIINSDATSAVNVTNTPSCDEQDWGPDWSPDGDHIAYASSRGGEASHVWVMEPDGANPVNLTPDMPGSDYPAWSPDGTQIAFSFEGTIWVMGADGTNRRRLTEGLHDSMPAWSPDGSQIAFAADRDGDWEIYLLDLSTEAVIQLTFNDDADHSPTWRPVSFPTVDAAVEFIIGSVVEPATYGADVSRYARADAELRVDILGLDEGGGWTVMRYPSGRLAAGDVGMLSQQTVPGALWYGGLDAWLTAPENLSDYDGALGGGSTSLDRWAIEATNPGNPPATTAVDVNGWLTVFQEDGTDLRGNLPDADVTTTRKWRSINRDSWLGGSVLRTAKRWAKLTFTADVVEGQVIGIVMRTAPNRGEAKIRLDGVNQGRIDTYSATKRNRVIVWQTPSLEAGTHSIQIMNLATDGRPRIDVDAFVIAGGIRD